MSPVIYFDFISPYAYLSWKWLKKTNRLEIFDFKPLVLGKVFSHWGQKPITEIESKKNYLYRKCQRLALKENIEIQLPFQHPFNTLYTLRISSKEICNKLEINQIKLLDCLWDLTWKEKVNVADPDILTESLINKGIVKARELIDLSYEREFKKVVLANVEEATQRGIFGVPTIYFKNEFFWGFDSFEDFFEEFKNEY